MKRTALKLALFIFGTVSAGTATAQFAKPEDAIKYRQGSFFVMQQNFARVMAMAQGKLPFDAAAAARYAEVATHMSKLPWEGFTTEAKGGKAKDNIWSEKAKFDAGAKDLMSEMEALNAAAKSGSLEAIKTAVGKVGATCKSCHDDFRSK